ncbi:MAG: zinc-ribbon domain-containing protein [Eubacterium sp.]|nr:zinc-ribbon domain-containing protein [Eubacterium sp.]
MAFCKKCGNELPDGTKFCPKCGAPVDEHPEAGTGSANQPTGTDINATHEDGAHGQALGSLICGIVGVVMWFFGYSCIVSVILGIVGIVLAENAKKSGNLEGMRTAGFVLSVIALIVGVIVTIYLIVALAFAGAVYGSMLHWLFSFF